MTEKETCVEKSPSLTPPSLFKLNLKGSKIELKEHQIEHNDILNKIMLKYPVVCDFSVMGSGKSFVSSNIALTNELKFKHVIVVGPLSIQSDWNIKKNRYKVPIHTFISYQSLRSVKGQFNLKHGLLNRFDSIRTKIHDGREITVNIIEFKATELYKKLVEEGLLLIIDEIQNAKNLTTQFLACKELIKEIVGNCNFINKPVNNSRVILLSGTPFDKKNQIVNFLRLINLMKDNNLCEYSVSTQFNIWTGFNDILKVSKNIDKVKTNGICYLTENTGKTNELINIVYDIFQNIIKQRISHSMPPIKLDVSIDKKNAFYHIFDDDSRQLLEQAVIGLKKVLRYNNVTRNIEFNNNENILSKIQSHLHSIETAKIKTFARITKEILDNDPNSKIVVCLNYILPLQDLYNELKQYNPLLISGCVKSKDRATMIELFQQHNSKYRLIIAISAVVCEGINLDDQDGNYPRYCFINPNYSTIRMCQLSDRFRRALTKSDSVVHFVYGKHACELNLLDALARKSTIMKETTPEQVEAGMLFPVDYNYFIEKTDEDLNKDILIYLNKNGKQNKSTEEEEE